MLKPEQKQRMTAMWNAGAKVPEIAREVRCAPETVRRYIPDHARRQRWSEGRMAQTAERRAKDEARNASRRTPEELGRVKHEPPVNRAEALFDPARDGDPEYMSMTSVLCGDPPVGRREMLEAWAEQHPQARRGPEANWNF